MYASRNPEDITQIRAGVGIVIANSSGQILLEQRSDNHMWGLPGGRIEAGESITQAAVREALEETGLTIEITRLLGVYSEFAGRCVTFPDNVVQLVDIILVAKIVKGSLACSEESDRLEFFGPENLPDCTVPPARGPIADYFGGESCVIR